QDGAGQDPQISPNPARDMVKINLPGTGTGKTTIRIISAEGKAVIESSTNNNFIHYDISNLKPGVYMVQTVQNGQVTATGKLLVNK
ncbi:MAG TPA: DUF2101 family protein, partial [Ferruginibacter sp.]|nr:DUF2101 family protein [Ferruginibacter sp.]